MPSELGSEFETLILRRFDAGAGPSLADVGETELLRRLANVAEAVRAVAGPTAATESGSAAFEVVVGTGDDAAILRPAPGRDLVVSQDATVEGKDFRRDWISPSDLGARALQIALSDLAGSGARPEYCLATLCAPAATRLDDVLAIQAGLCAAAASVGCVVAGGDVSDIDGPIVIDVAVTGSVLPGHHLAMAAGKVGDLLVVTGWLGRAAAGLALLFGRDGDGVAADRDVWLDAQLRPRARLAEGELLAATARAGTDISDGLLVSAHAIATASHCGVEVWRDGVPVDASLRSWPDWFELAVAGGEDFEILATVAANQLDSLLSSWPPGLAPLHVVGQLVAGTGLTCRDRRGGQSIGTARGGSRHYG